jgi:OOP family OmpA-OmpF porin
MVRVLGMCALIISSLRVHSQAIFDKHPATLGINITLYDFKNSSPLKKWDDLDPGISAIYLHGINKHFDFQASLHGAFPDSTSKNNTSVKQSFLFQSDVSLRTRLFSPYKVFQPFILSGIGGSFHQNSFGSYFLIAPGIELRYKTVFLTLSASYHVSLTDNLNNHYKYSIGVAGLLSKPKKQKPILPAIPVQSKPLATDRDNDGTFDSVDVCPDIPGLAQLQGCPDSDRDGIADNYDLCPTVFGYAEYKGCPYIDSDNDGIKDEDDKCPKVPGLVKYNGCPVPDKDGDGVNDEEDNCIEVPGVKTNRGCPVIDKEVATRINLAANNIYFKTGSFELLPKSYPALNDVVSILKQTPTIMLTIEGHTDNVGNEKNNQVLSENRAQTVMNYLTKKGIDKARLNAIGYGMQKPIASNETTEGRSKNRRVELKAIN